MEDLGELSAVVCTIIESPYTPSLQNLRHVLERIDLRLVQLWGQANACQIDSLAAITIEGLELWPYALEILRILAFIPSFRDAVLAQKPMLLHSLLAKASQSKSAFDKYAATCVSLFSSPLDVAIPSNFAPFLMQLMERAASSLSLDSLWPVYRLLSAIGPCHLDTLSNKIIDSLQNELLEVLNKLKMDDDRFETVLCLAVLAKLASRPRTMVLRDDDRTDTVQSPRATGLPALPDQRAFARRFFAKKAYKTFDLIILKAKASCSESCTSSTGDICESLKLSEEVVDACDPSERVAWIAKSGSKIKSLQSKILRPGIDLETQCMAVNLIVAFFHGQELPPDIWPILETHLMTSGLATLSRRAIDRYLSLANEQSIDEVLSKFVTAIDTEDKPSSGLMASVGNTLKLATIFKDSAYQSPKLRSAILGCISSNRLGQLLRPFAPQKSACLNSVENHRKLQLCPTAYTNLQTRLIWNVNSIVLSAALGSGMNHEGLGSMLIAFLKNQTALDGTFPRCKAFHRAELGIQATEVSLFEAESTPSTSSISHDWRDTLVREMSREANCRYQSITRIFSEVCRDLELRCDDAERPLREEQSKCHDLKVRLEDCQAKIGQIESRLHNQTSSLEAAEHANDVLENQLKVSHERCQILQISMDETLQDFSQVKFDAHRASQLALDIARQQDLAHIAIITGKDEMLDEQALKIINYNNCIADQEQLIVQLKDQSTKDAKVRIEKEESISMLNSALSSAKELANAQKAELERMVESEKAVILQKHELQTAYNCNEKLISKLREDLCTARAATSQLQQKYDMYATTKTAEVLQLEKSNRISIENSRSEFDKAKKTSAINDKKNASVIAELRGSNRRLRKEVEARDKAREHLDRFYATLQDRNTYTTSTTKQSRYGNGLSPDSNHVNQTVSSDHESVSIDSSTSTKNRPTRKRVRVRRESQTSSKSLTKSAEQPDSTRNMMRQSPLRARRTPLSELEPTQNDARSTPIQKLSKSSPDHYLRGSHIAYGDNDVYSMPDSDGEDFGGSGIFTSTECRSLSADRLEISRKNYDETTVDL